MKKLFETASALLAKKQPAAGALGRVQKQRSTRELLTLESAIGAALFGEIPAGHRREFFCLDKDTWIWHEEWLDEKRVRHQVTTRYEVQEKGVLKVQEGARYEYISGEELQRMLQATALYYERVARSVYCIDPVADSK